MFTYTEREIVLEGLHLLIEQESHGVRWAMLSEASHRPTEWGVHFRARQLATAGRIAIELTEALV